MAMYERARKVCGSVRMWEKNPKSACWNDVRRKMLAGNDEEAKERCMEAYREENRKVKR